MAVTQQGQVFPQKSQDGDAMRWAYRHRLGGPIAGRHGPARDRSRAPVLLEGPDHVRLQRLNRGSGSSQVVDEPGEQRDVDGRRE